MALPSGAGGFHIPLFGGFGRFGRLSAAMAVVVVNPHRVSRKMKREFDTERPS